MDTPNSPPIQSTTPDTAPGAEMLHGRRVNRLTATLAAMTVVFSGCSIDVDARPNETTTSPISATATPGTQTTSPEATPTQSASPEIYPTPKPTTSETITQAQIARAERVLESFRLKPLVPLTDYSQYPNVAMAKEAAEKYLDLKKHSRVVLVNYTDVDNDIVMAYGKVLQEEVRRVTGGAYSINSIDVRSATGIERNIHEIKNPDGVYVPDDPKKSAAVISAALMPKQVGEDYTAIIALTDDQIVSEDGEANTANALLDGPYINVGRFSELAKLPISSEQNYVVVSMFHEYMHTVGLGHSKVVTKDGLGIYDNSLSSSGGLAHINLEKFFKGSFVEEYSTEGNIMGLLDGSLSVYLNNIQKWISEYPERILGKPSTISTVDLNKSLAARFDATSKSIAVLDLDSVIALDDQTYISQLAFTPKRIETSGVVTWNLEIDAIDKSSNGVAGLGAVKLSLDPASGFPSATNIYLPGGSVVSCKVFNNDTLSIANIKK